MASNLQGQTDQEVTFQLQSALLDARWLDSEGFVNGAATLEIRTLNVGDGAKVTVVLRDRQGSSLEEFKGQVIAGLHRRRIPLKANAEGGVFFEVKLPDHGLSAISGRLIVGPAIALKAPQWKDHEEGSAVSKLKRGMHLELECETLNVPADRGGHFEIWSRQANRADKLAARIPARQDAGKLKALWVFDYRDPTLALSAESALRAEGENYAAPDMVLKAECLGLTVEGPKVPFEDVQVIRVVDADGVPVPGQKVKLTLPDGSTREASADSEGKVVVDPAPPGRIAVEWVIEA